MHYEEDYKEKEVRLRIGLHTLFDRTDSVAHRVVASVAKYTLFIKHSLCIVDTSINRSI